MQIVKEVYAQGLGGGPPPSIAVLEVTYFRVVDAILGFVGIVLFIMLILGGFKFLTSGGDPKGVEEAKKTLTYAIGGAILVILSFLILRFIEEFTGAPVTDFEVRLP